MGYIVALLWGCAFAGAGLTLWLVYELTRPNEAEDVHGNEYHRMCEALDERRIRNRPGIAR